MDVDDETIERVPLFDLFLNAGPVRRYSLLFVHDVELTLTAAAAAALNDIFGVSAFAEGIPIGTASVFTAVIPRP